MQIYKHMQECASEFCCLICLRRGDRDNNIDCRIVGAKKTGSPFSKLSVLLIK